MRAALLASVALAAAVCAGSAMAATPHGSRFLVFFAPIRPGASSRHGLVLTDRRGRILRVLSTASYGTFARWSPDDASIAWEDPAGIHVEAADGSGKRLLVSSAGSCARCQNVGFVWSPDSRSLVVGPAGPKGDELQRVPLSGPAPQTMVSSAWTVLTPASWTSDGRSLVYDESGTTLAHPFARLVVFTPATHRRRVVWQAATGQGANVPRISPDGREWAYVDEVDQFHQRLRLVDRVSGRTHVVAGVNPTNLLAWSPDSRTLAVLETDRQVVVVDSNGTVLRRIGPGEQVSWGRNGELFVLRGSYDQVWSSHAGGPERFLFRVPKGDFVVSLDAS